MSNDFNFMARQFSMDTVVVHNVWKIILEVFASHEI